MSEEMEKKKIFQQQMEQHEEDIKGKYKIIYLI